MRRIWLFGLAVAAVLMTMGSAQAATIGFVPGSASGAPGDSIMLDIVVSGLGGEIVSAYDLDILYDAAVVAPTAVSFSGELGVALSDAGLPSLGVLDLAAVSLQSDAELMALQNGDSVTLATLTFELLAPGETALLFSFDAFNDVNGANALVLDLVAESGRISSVVPEPGAAILFAIGALLVTRSTRWCRR